MFSKISEAVLKLFVLYKDEEGQGLVEYALILGLVSIVAIAALTLLGGAITGRLTFITDVLGGGSGSA